ncbi:uncharacterized protein BDR25DRAFT_308197 [Lindgomyces ingoldianus]|uniref:Uncharacterized protein n=1 Tax=Lindgomyces ingoldianus TaxID=673940 RepID=A0ACB6Q7W9_9PLEO|nr:uncharacterized protein BDR25DRAFT_308197 [Lindgomyces ingoldianus]KAF2462683.1 hypothetical protein BDR25DRAFT_308197 [Lindgomyces ingoldianus]
MANSVPVPVVAINEQDKTLFKSINTFVHNYMSQPHHDNSHDYYHILRVVSNANKLLEAELTANPDLQYDTLTIFLAALLHDVGDYKYAKAGEDIENQISHVLRERGASDELAAKVQTIVHHVSYTHEVKNTEAVMQVLAKYPELAIVQDADRLDAIGAVGVGRCFAFGGARRQGQPMSLAVDHFGEKLLKLPAMMKTASGRAMAVSRKKVLEDFEAQFREETRLSFSLE